MTHAPPVLALLVTCLCSSAAFAQESKAQPARMEPGPGHAQLDRLVGSWNTRHVLEWAGETHVVNDTETYGWMEPTRVWLRKEVSAYDHPIVGEMNGLDLWSYDDKTGEYLNYWFDNQSPETFEHRGGWEDDNTLVMNGMIVWDGRKLYLKNVITFDGPDHFVLTHSQSWDTDSDFAVRSSVDYRRREVERQDENGSDTVEDPGEDPGQARAAWRDHLASMTDGVWMTSNASYMEEDEGIDEYGMAYRLHPGGLSATGCLWQQREGDVDAVAWQFFMGWDPTKQAGLMYQSNAAGMVATGFLKDRGEGEPELIQELRMPDGSGVRVGHIEALDGPDRRMSRSVRWVDGKWTPQRSYTWERERGRSHPC